MGQTGGLAAPCLLRGGRQPSAGKEVPRARAGTRAQSNRRRFRGIRLVSKLRGKVLLLLAVPAIALPLALAASSAIAKDDNSRQARASLDSYQETPTRSTTGHGRFSARIKEGSIEYT